MMRIKTAIIFIGLILIIAAPYMAQAGPHDIVVIRPGGPSPSEQAQQQIDRLTKELARKSGWDSVGVVGRYFTDEKEALAYIKANKPGFVLSSLGFYLKYGKPLGLKVINQAILNGKTESKYYVVVKKGAYKSIDELAGKTMAGAHLQEPEFVERIVFENRMIFGVDVNILPERALRSLRKLTKGKVDAVILDQKEYNSLGELDFAKELELIFSSAPIPNNGFAVISANINPADIKAFEKAAANFCRYSDAKTICEDFDIQGFSPVNQSVFSKYKTMYSKGK